MRDSNKPTKNRGLQGSGGVGDAESDPRGDAPGRDRLENGERLQTALKRIEGEVGRMRS